MKLRMLILSVNIHIKFNMIFKHKYPYSENVKLKRKESQNKTLEMVSAGLHCSFRISRQILPLLLMFGWKTLVLNATWYNKIKHHQHTINNTNTTRISHKQNPNNIHIHYLRRLERIIGRKMNGNQKNTSSIRTISRTHNRCLPMEHVFGNRTYKWTKTQPNPNSNINHTLT